MGKRKPLFDRHKNVRAVLFALAIVMFWRGAWGFMDLYVFPDDPNLSFGISLLAGLILVFLLNHHKIELG